MKNIGIVVLHLMLLFNVSYMGAQNTQINWGERFELEKKEQLVRFSFCAGAMVNTIMLTLKQPFLDRFFDGKFDQKEALEMLINFSSAGMKAQKTKEKQ